MREAIKVHYNGQVFVPDEPVDLPVGSACKILPFEQDSEEEYPLMKLVRIGQNEPTEVNLPRDFASNLDHYLYRIPKQK